MNRSRGFSLQPSILAYILELTSAMYFYRAALPGPPLRSGFINRTRLPLFPSAFIHLSSLSLTYANLSFLFGSYTFLIVPTAMLRSTVFILVSSRLVAHLLFYLILHFTVPITHFTHIVLQLSHPFRTRRLISSVPHSHHLSSRTLIQSSHILSQSPVVTQAFCIMHCPYYPLFLPSFLLQHPILLLQLQLQYLHSFVVASTLSLFVGPIHPPSRLPLVVFQ